MAKAAVVGRGQEITDGQMIQFLQLKRKGLRTRSQMQAFLDGHNPFEIPEDFVEQWNTFYYKVFGINVDFLGVDIPKDSNGFNQVIFMLKDLSYDEVEKACKETFKFQKCEKIPLSRLVKMDSEERTTTHSYAIRTRASVEADKTYRHKTAEMIAQEGVKSMTLLERLVYGLFFYWMSDKKKHLDYEYVTLCAGSRFWCSSTVPSVYFGSFNGSVCVDRDWLGARSATLRVREVVA